MNMNTNTIPVEGQITTRRHTGPGLHRASKKIDRQLQDATETRRRTRTAKAPKGGRYRAESKKTNLTWFFFGFGPVAAAAFAGVLALLVGMSMSEPVTVYQTKTETVHETRDVSIVSETCVAALNLADKGFDVALSKPLVKLLDKGKSSKSVTITPKFAKSMQIEIYKISAKYDFVKNQCLTDIPDAKTTSVRTTSNIK